MATTKIVPATAAVIDPAMVAVRRGAECPCDVAVGLADRVDSLDFMMK